MQDAEFCGQEDILYVNGEYRGDSEIGKLMHDFNCTQADDMTFPLMAEKTRYKFAAKTNMLACGMKAASL